MQQEVAAANPRHEVHMHAINQIGKEGGIDGMCQGRTLPVCQDDTQHNVWESWKITYRDVVIVDPGGDVAGVYNLTEHTLAEPANYDSLKAMILQVANED
jgi:hypothetical protein